MGAPDPKDTIKNSPVLLSCSPFLSLQVRRVLKLLERPYEDSECFLEVSEEREEEESVMAAASAVATCSSGTQEKIPYSSKPPLWASELCVT